MVTDPYEMATDPSVGVWLRQVQATHVTVAIPAGGGGAEEGGRGREGASLTPSITQSFSVTVFGWVGAGQRAP